MTTIQVKCVDQNLQILNSPMVASGGLQETSMQFSFCEKWNGLAKTAVFYRDKSEVYNVVLDSENKCLIPDEIVQEKGRIYFGVYGISESKRKTTFILKYDIQEGAFIEGVEPSEPTPNIYEQLLTNYGEIIEAYRNIFNSLDSKTRSLIAKGIVNQNNPSEDLEIWIGTKEEKEEVTEQQNTLYFTDEEILPFDIIELEFDEHGEHIANEDDLLVITNENASRYALKLGYEILYLQSIEDSSFGDYYYTYANSKVKIYFENRQGELGAVVIWNYAKDIFERISDINDKLTIKEAPTTITKSGLYHIEVMNANNGNVSYSTTMYLELGTKKIHDFVLYQFGNATMERCFISCSISGEITLSLDYTFPTDYYTLGTIRFIGE